MVFIGVMTLAVTPSAHAQTINSSVAAKQWAEKMFENRSHDFRAVGRGTKCEYHFELTNLYEQDVHIAGVRSSCGCTTPTITKDTLKTHEKSSIVATFNTSTFVGQKSAVVTVIFDRPAYAEVQLTVSGFIRTDITFEPNEVTFGEIGIGQTAEQDVVITHRGSNDWRITDVRSLCSDLQVRLSSPEISPGIVRYRMKVNVLESMPEGDVRERLTLISNDRNFPTTEMSINGRVRPPLSISPAAMSFGTVQPGATVSKRVLLRGEKPFAVTQVICPDSRFQFDLPEGSKTFHVLNVRFAAGAEPARVGQEIRVVTDMNDGKSVTCVLTGTIAGS
ncbi:DUF1573 domain-containing protein [Stieleria varia]|nr:DUF1573 domain-containing protein [Stieleria varia]